jgi:hypothetical protein
MAGGYLANPDDIFDYLYCQASDTNAVLRAIGLVDALTHAWRDIGFLSAILVFNVLSTFLVYWLAKVGLRGWLAFVSVLIGRERQRSFFPWPNRGGRREPFPGPRKRIL